MLAELKFFSKEELVPTVPEQPVKHLGRWYDASLKDKEKVQQLQEEIRNAVWAVAD